VTTRFLSVVLLTLAAMCTRAQTADSAWYQMLRASGYAESVRAGFRYQCRENAERAATPQFRNLCPKIDDIPSRIIEAAALTCVKRYVSLQAADEVRKFWESDHGRELQGKMTREIETGRRDILDASDLKLLEDQNATEGAQAMLAFSKDFECSRSVARAMLAYEP
jgi:hypothetical protein